VHRAVVSEREVKKKGNYSPLFRKERRISPDSFVPVLVCASAVDFLSSRQAAFQTL
jgi:hypothetical protein